MDDAVYGLESGLGMHIPCVQTTVLVFRLGVPAAETQSGIPDTEQCSLTSMVSCVLHTCTCQLHISYAMLEPAAHSPGPGN